MSPAPFGGTPLRPMCARGSEVLSGQTFGEYLRAQIFEPLGMKDTGFYVPASEQHRLISFYAPNNPFDPMASDYPSLNQQMAAPIVSSQPLKAEGRARVNAPGLHAFVQMLTHQGSWKGEQILNPTRSR